MSDEAKSDVKEGLPGWVMTFADLMSLLMCFFVLLLSFSEMDVQKFKQLAGSMKNAFGVQKSVNVKDIPTGTSIIAQEFSPGKPVPTSINEMRQQTTDDLKHTLDFTDSEHKGQLEFEDDGEDKKGEENEKIITEEGSSSYEGIDEEGDSFLQGIDDEGSTDFVGTDEEKIEAAKELLEQKFKEAIENEAGTIREHLKEELIAGLIEVDVVDDEVLIRIKEKSSFPSGNADIRKSFYPIMDKIGSMLSSTINGRVVVAGHTDNVPINTERYPSNWVLSAARAANVVHYLSKYSKVPHERMEIRAHAETKALMENDSFDNRAKNRRVEIIVKYDRADLVDVGFMTDAGVMQEISSQAIPLDSQIPVSAKQNDKGESSTNDSIDNGIKNADEILAEDKELEADKTEKQTDTDTTSAKISTKRSSEDEIKALEAVLRKMNQMNSDNGTKSEQNR